MPEFISVSASSYDPAGLATKLTEKSAEGWEVVAIVPTGGDITAFLRRGGAIEGGAVRPAAAAAAVTSGPSPVVEPVGWGTTPAATSAPAPSNNAPLGAYGNGSSAGGYGSTQHATPQPASVQQATGPASAAASTSSVSGTPAGWYHDPSGRFELRYWNGSEWTEHVSRSGQQYTDPPVA